MIILDMVDFDVFLGIEWLSTHQAILDYYAKTVILPIPGRSSIIWQGLSGLHSSKVISYIQARKLVDCGCLVYLAFIHDTIIEPPLMESFPIIQEFDDIFPTDLPRVPPDKNIDFAIDLQLSTKPFSIPPYHMAPAELK